MVNHNELISGVLSRITIGNLVLFILSYVFFRIIQQVVYYRFFSPIKDFPGPFWASVTRIWIAWYNLRETEVQALEAAHKKYGPVVRISPTMLHVSEAKNLPVIYHRQVNKSKFYITGSFGRTEAIFNMSDYRTHAYFRRYIAGPYSFTNVKKMESLIDTRVEHWITALEDRFATTNARFDFSPWGVFLTYDVISEVGFGAPFGFVEKGEDIGGLIQGIEDGAPYFGLMCRLYPLTEWVKTTPLAYLLVARPEDNNGMGVLMRFRDKLFEQRAKDIKAAISGGRVDLLQRFLEARDNDGQPLDLAWIKAEALVILIAGAGTAGATLQTMIVYLLNHPSAFERVMNEVDSATKRGLLSFPIAQYSEVQAHLPYYIACLHESMRLNPVISNLMPRLVSPGGIKLQGKFVPEGIEVSSNPYIVHRDKAIYGEDAEEFKPERWLEDESKAKEYAKYNLAFGYGSRICLGKDIAMMELFKGPLEFFRRFHFESAMEGSKSPRFVVKGGVGTWHDMWFRIQKRPKVEVRI